MREQFQKLIDEDETLRFHCDNCKKEWVETRPKDKWIRSGKESNHYVPMMNEDGPRTPIACKHCSKTDKIRRMAPPMRASTNDHTYDSKKSMIKWATNPITQEEMLGEKEIP